MAHQFSVCSKDKAKVQTKVTYLTKGCKCKKGYKGRCSHYKVKQECGPSCTCVNCTNTSKKGELQEDRREELLMESEDENSSSDEDDEMENEVRIDQDNDDQDSLNKYYEELNEEIDLMIDGIF